MQSSDLQILQVLKSCSDYIKKNVPDSEWFTSDIDKLIEMESPHAEIRAEDLPF